MTNVAEPRHAVDMDGREGRASVQDGELTRLVRRWVAAGTLVQPLEQRKEPEERANILRFPAEPAAASPPPGHRESGLGLPPLPRRSTGAGTDRATRVALLIDARRVPAEAAAGLLARLSERGSLNVCRAYGDWGAGDLGDWVGRMRREGLHSFHQFADDDDQALVAMAIDAVDIARDAAVDEVVVAGDLTSALPLVHRLHGAGVRVVAVGPAHTPHDVRAACDEFIDIGTLDDVPVVPEGRHRA